MKGDRANPTGLIFPGRDSGKAHQKNGINRVAQEIADKMALAPSPAWACFKTWGTEETTFQREVIECALAHRIGNDETEAAYQRGDTLKSATNRRLRDVWHLAYVGNELTLFRGWRGAPKLQILAERRRERCFPTVVEYRF